MMAIVGHSCLGLFVWSLYHYTGHRVWHWWMSRGYEGGVLRKEVQHHDHYDAHMDPDEAHLSFPWDLWVLTGVLVIGYAVWFGLRPGLAFGLGAFGGMTVDDQLHRQMHRGTLGWGWFVRWHADHHRTHVTNYAMATGAIWDRLFGTSHKEH